METEFKLQLPDGAAAIVEQRLQALPLTSVRLRARYYDTPDAALRTAGVSLRLRQEGSRWVQAAKYAGSGTLLREEHEVDVGGIDLASPPVPDIALHQGTKVGRRLQKALHGHAGDTPQLVEMFATDVERLTQIVEIGASRMELALDRGEVGIGSGPDSRSIAVEELELELKAGRIGDLALLARQWCADLGAWVSIDTKAAKGWRLAGAGRDLVHDPRKAASRLPEKPGGSVLMRALVARCLAELLPHASRVASGQNDEDAVHRLRVGIRRLRTVLRELSQLTQGADPAWEPALAATFGRLGQWRDRSNVEAGLLPDLARHGAPDIPSGMTDAEPVELPQTAVRDTDFQQCLISMMAFAADDSATDPGLPARQTRALLRKKVRRLHGKVQSAAEVFEELPSTEQHRARKRLKRLRYLTEFVGPVFDKRRSREFIERIKPAQDALGLQNDEAVALQTLHALTARHAQAWFGVGWYSARRAGLAKASRKALAKAVARKPW